MTRFSNLAGCCLLFALTSLCSCIPFVYGVDIVNYGQNGVIILGLGEAQPFVREPYMTVGATGEERWHDDIDPGLKGVAFVIAMDPEIPDKYRDPSSAFGRFPGYEKSLPEKIEIVWQLAELRDCKSEKRVTPLERDPFYLQGIANAKLLWSEFDRERAISHVRERAGWSRVQALGYDPAQHVWKSGCTWIPLPEKIYRKTLNLDAIREAEAYKKTGKRNDSISLSRHMMNIKLIFIEDQIKVEARSKFTNPWK